MTTAVQVEVWDVCAVKMCMLRTTIPPEFNGAMGPQPPGYDRIVCALAWAPNSRIIFAGTGAGLVYAWDVASGSLLRAFALPGTPRFIRCHPRDYRCVRTCLRACLPACGSPLQCGLALTLQPRRHTRITTPADAPAYYFAPLPLTLFVSFARTASS